MAGFSPIWPSMIAELDCTKDEIAVNWGVLLKKMTWNNPPLTLEFSKYCNQNEYDY